MKNVVIKKFAANKIRSFFPWVYRNEIQKISENIKVGEIVKILSPDNDFLGT